MARPSKPLLDPGERPKGNRGALNSQWLYQQMMERGWSRERLMAEHNAQNPTAQPLHRPTLLNWLEWKHNNPNADVVIQLIGTFGCGVFDLFESPPA